MSSKVNHIAAPFTHLFMISFNSVAYVSDREWLLRVVSLCWKSLPDSQAMHVFVKIQTVVSQSADAKVSGILTDHTQSLVPSRVEGTCWHMHVGVAVGSVLQWISRWISVIL